MLLDLNESRKYFEYFCMTMKKINLKESNHSWSLAEKLKRSAWMIVWFIFGKYGIRKFSIIRVLVLRMFGAKIGHGVLICSGVKVLMPWNLEIGDAAAIAEGVDIYNHGKVVIGSDTVISQRVTLCTGTHDITKSNFPLIWKPITIGQGVWLAAECFVLPGAYVNDYAVVGARSVVSGEVEAWSVYASSKAIKVGSRKIVS